jgi:hypothetical protein
MPAAAAMERCVRLPFGAVLLVVVVGTLRGVAAAVDQKLSRSRRRNIIKLI